MPKRYTDEFKMNIVELHKAGLKIPRELSWEIILRDHEEILATLKEKD